MYYAISIDSLQVIADSEHLDGPRYWAKKFGEETGEKVVVVKAMEFYKAGQLLPKEEVNLEDFQP